MIKLKNKIKYELKIICFSLLSFIISEICRKIYMIPTSLINHFIYSLEIFLLVTAPVRLPVTHTKNGNDKEDLLCRNDFQHRINFNSSIKIAVCC